MLRYNLRNGFDLVYHGHNCQRWKRMLYFWSSPASSPIPAVALLSDDSLPPVWEHKHSACAQHPHSTEAWNKHTPFWTNPWRENTRGSSPLGLYLAESWCQRLDSCPVSSSSLERLSQSVAISVWFWHLALILLYNSAWSRLTKKKKKKRQQKRKENKYNFTHSTPPLPYRRCHYLPPPPPPHHLLHHQG